jgi:hypothetical protein
MQEFMRFFCLFGVPVFIVAAVCIWNPGTEEKPGKPVADRIAWTVFVLGISLMASMGLYVIAAETDGDWRTWDTIRLHSRIFLGLSIIPVAGPLVVYLVQATRKHTPSVSNKKSPVDDWNDADRPVRP